jgi:hypothetical protein
VDDQNWYEYKKGVILLVDSQTGIADSCIEYVSPSDTHAPRDPILFKSGTLHENRLYVCTQTEVLVYDLPSFTRVGYVSLPCFNDVHHVRPTPEGHLLIANSGLEMVLEVTLSGDVLRAWNVLGQDPWANFSREVDYRKGINLKPHQAHPNYVFYLDGEIWTTRFEQRDAATWSSQTNKPFKSKKLLI